MYRTLFHKFKSDVLLVTALREIAIKFFSILLTTIREDADIDLVLSAELVHGVTADGKLFFYYSSDKSCLEITSDNKSIVEVSIIIGSHI